MKEHPILFSGPMVQAILAGQKTVTRRAVKPSLASQFDEPRGPDDIAAGYPFVETKAGMSVPAALLCPHGQPGDRLWVREAWAEINVAQAPGEKWIVYRECDNRTDYGGPWKPSIHMRRRDSRILLEVTAVRVERLQDINEQQALAEGVMLAERDIDPGGNDLSALELFGGLWVMLNGMESWNSNPWVWVVEFKRVTP
ncbi:hypothetical protein NRB16_07800 [Pseudomonas sp. LJDD11]|uniref:hypothetical protein n=1 Tax=Pseudomonas sp. LJDD11 TaxID=2931984 RepID=UPI00211BA8E6|nr:hypothetical protein [Pseudomonas sp. LJDD11]MCQ9423424.1 hypothetical protein [Pseudomonas sp. LJDD11]